MSRLPEAVYVATAPVNLHLSFDRLAGIVREVLLGRRLAISIIVDARQQCKGHSR